MYEEGDIWEELYGDNIPTYTYEPEEENIPDNYVYVTTLEQHFSDITDKDFNYKVLEGECKIKTVDKYSFGSTYHKKVELYCKPGSIVEYSQHTFVSGEPPYGKDYESERSALIYVNSKDDIKEHLFVLQKERDMSGEHIKARKVPEVCKQDTFPDKYTERFCKAILEEY